jgi:hypothetical protein
VRIDDRTTALTVISAAALGIVAASTVSAPTAFADPVSPAPGPEPTPVVLPVPAPAPTDPTVAASGALPGALPGPEALPEPAPTELPTPPDGVPHLSSPENLPPGTTDVAPDNQQRPLGYLRDIWHAYQTQEVNGRDALLLLAQRPMSGNSVPPGMSSNPTPPTPPLPDAAPAPAPPTP